MNLERPKFGLQVRALWNKSLLEWKMGFSNSPDFLNYSDPRERVEEIEKKTICPHQSINFPYFISTSILVFTYCLLNI